ncbi:MAG: signal peptide peptidase SppA [Desulfobacteraceae bacterium]|nr:signal peptide peptidase SppA [Desulfobacteraceae bacterium]
MVASLLVAASLYACAAPRITLFPDTSAPLQEFTLEGSGRDKVLLLPVSGVISDEPDKQGMRYRPSMVQEVVAHLQRAQKDPNIKAMVLKVNSPGGSTTASDILYHEILTYKERNGIKLVAAMMNIAASGGYYISLPADVITAHPTTITGSVGVVFLRMKIYGLMDKIGVTAAVNTSGENKDMMSPFRASTEKEDRLIQELTDNLAKRFFQLVAKHRKLDDGALADVRTARVYLAEDARKIGLIDRIGYLSDAVKEAKQIAGLAEDARVVVYRRSEFNDDNLYNTATSDTGQIEKPVVDLNLMPALDPGFYFMWAPVIGMQ